MFRLELNVEIPLHESKHTLDYKLFRQILIDGLVQNYFPQPIIYLWSELLNELVSDLHPLNAMTIMKGWFVSTSAD
jgi:hypothetical protein